MKGGNENYDKQIDYLVKLLKDIDNIYKNASTEKKQLIIRSVFPKRLIFENNKYRTPVINKVVSLLCSNNGQFKSKKNGKYIFNDVLSTGVGPLGIEPSTS